MEGQKTPKRRIRKTAPTLREKAEAARAKAEIEKPKRLRRVARATVRPLKRLRLPDNRLTRPLKKVGRGIKKAAGWLVPKYFVNSWRELSMVAWPSRKETWRLTAAVFVFAIALGLAVAGVDKVLESMFRKFILKD